MCEDYITLKKLVSVLCIVVLIYDNQPQEKEYLGDFVIMHVHIFPLVPQEKDYLGDFVITHVYICPLVEFINGLIHVVY